MFFIIALVCIAAFIILLIFCPLKAAIRLDNLHVHMTVSFLFIRIKREYVMRWDKKEIMVIYQIRNGKRKRIDSLKSLLLRKQKGEPTDISFIDLLKIIGQYRHKENKNAFSYLNKKSSFLVKLQVSLGAGDAYYTALLCGWAATVGGSLCAVFTRNKKRFSISVKPGFNQLVFSLHADCIIAMTPANIILGYFIYKIRSRSKKNASD